MENNYEHKQNGGFAMYFAGLTIIFMATAFYYILKKAPLNDFADKINCIIFLVAGILSVGVLVWAALLMSSLNIKIDADFVRVIFGMGMFRKKFALKDIIYCKTVKNKWWHGWGIHMCGGGWLYNVSGFDAVEITMASGRKNRIGTDEPEKLAEAIGPMINQER
ncbi:MAG TPA: hypothetical protein ENH34_06300 [Phycisphaerales bacterium]|nr:hypothetical protein [Phycisphaerales bacterium]